MTQYIRRVAYTRKVGNKLIHVPSRLIKARSQSGLKRSSIDKKKLEYLKKIHLKARKRFGTPKCKKNEIIKEGYKTKKNSWIKPTCIKDVGNKGKGIQRFILEKGTLSRFGYHDISNLSLNKRHSSLKKAVKKLKPTTVMRKINALYVLNKNKEPKLARIFKNDVKFVQNLPEYKNSLEH